jgi:hypothetical protein
MDGREPETEGVEGLARPYYQLAKYLLPEVHILIRKGGV